MIAAHADICHFGSMMNDDLVIAPSLSLANRTYGKGTAEAFLACQLVELSEFAGVRVKPDNASLDSLIGVVMTNYYFLNMAEICLFCNRFKAGKYGRFYGNVDPLVITTSLNEFCRERQTACEAHERKLADERWKREKQNSNPIPCPEGLLKRFMQTKTGGQSHGKAQSCAR